MNKLKVINSSNKFYKTNKFSSGGNIPTAVPGHFLKAPKVKDITIWINFINQKGMLRRLPAWPGTILHTLLLDAKTPHFWAQCEGGSMFRKISDDTVALADTGPTCGDCHVRISEPWFTQMKSKVHPLETKCLDLTQRDIFSNSRLACGISIKPWMNEMLVSQVRQKFLYQSAPQENTI